MKKRTEQQEEQARQHYINAPGKLALHSFRKQFKFTINYGMGDITIDGLVEHGYEIDYDVYLPTKKMNLQRGFVWTIDQKRELIKSILKGITIAPITVILFKSESYRRGQGRDIYRVIDGKQRLSTLISFYKGEFTIEHNGKQYNFDDLTGQTQHEICHCVRANIGYEYEDDIISDDDKIAWFEMINFAGTPQDQEHLKKLKE